jgi:uncharacterized protein YdeI (YjbR/CyaY-like superfamily)
VTPPEALSFETGEALEAWLHAHHATATELWIRVHKKQSATRSVTWNDCVVAAISWGWIDGQRRALDDVSFLQRLTPRRARSNWSAKNREHAERLIATARMQPTGLAQVKAARGDGRWDRAYVGSADMVMPADFLAALQQHVNALLFYETLGRSVQFGVYYRLRTAKREETRHKRMATMIARLARGEHP